MAIELQAQTREEQGKGPSRRLRRSGNVPAVLYAPGKETMSLAIEPRALRKAVSGPAGRNTLLALVFPGGKRTVLLKDVQFHPVKHELVHADFLEVELTKPVRIDIPVVLSGKNKNTGAGAVIEQVMRKLRTKALPTAIPDKIEVDISELKMGSSIHVNDLKLPAGINVLGDPKATVATLVALREEKVEEVAVVAEAVPGAVPGAPGAPGAAPGAPGAAAAPGKPGAAPAAGAAAPAAAAGKPAGKDAGKK